MPGTVTPRRRSTLIYDRLFVTFSLRRTGQHAILNWICRQLQDEGVTHFNNCGLSHRQFGFVKRQRPTVIKPINGRFLVYGRGGIKDSSSFMRRSWIPGLRYRFELALTRRVRSRHAVFSFEGVDISQDKLCPFCAATSFSWGEKVAQFPYLRRSQLRGVRSRQSNGRVLLRHLPRLLRAMASYRRVRDI